jgi:hypothetical protein
VLAATKNATATIARLKIILNSLFPNYCGAAM